MIKKSKQLTDLTLFIDSLKCVNIKEYQFHKPRKWKFDFAFPCRMVAVEYEGGIYRRGGGWHQSIGRMEGDMEKYNTAALDGWVVLRFSAKHVQEDIALKMIEQALRQADEK